MLYVTVVCICFSLHGCLQGVCGIPTAFRQTVLVQEVIAVAPAQEARAWWQRLPQLWNPAPAQSAAAADPAPVAYVPIDFSSAAAMEAEPFAADPVTRERGKFVLPADLGTFWGLLVLGLAYVHHSTTGFALPALLPLINKDLALSDSQGALLTVGYTARSHITRIPPSLRPLLLASSCPE